MKKAVSIVIGYDQKTIPEQFRLNPSVGYTPVEKGDRLMDGRIADKDGIEIYEKTLGTKFVEALPKVAAVAITTSPFWARYVAGLIHGLYDWKPDEFLHQHLTAYAHSHSDVSGITLDGGSSGAMDMGDGKIHLSASQVGQADVRLSGHADQMQVNGNWDGSGDVTVTGKVTGTNVEITDYGAQGQLTTTSNIDLDLKDVNAHIQNVNGNIKMDIPQIDINGDGKMEGVKLNIDGGQLQYRGELHGNLNGSVETSTETDFTDAFRQACLAGGIAEAIYFLRSYIPGTKFHEYRLNTRRELVHYRESMERDQKMRQLIPIGKNYADKAAGVDVKLKKLPDWVKKLAGVSKASKKKARGIIGAFYARKEMGVMHYEQLINELKDVNMAQGPVPTAVQPHIVTIPIMKSPAPKAPAVAPPATAAPVKPAVHPPAPKKAAAPAPVPAPAKVTVIAPVKPAAPPAVVPPAPAKPAKPMTFKTIRKK